MDIYDTAGSAWSTALLSLARWSLAAASAGGKVVFGGGYTNSATSNRVDIHDTVGGTWSMTALSQARQQLSAASAGNKIFFGGGYTGSASSNVVDIHDTVGGTWSTATLSQARFDLAAASVGNKVLFAGGYSETGGGISDVVDIYDTSSGTWSTAALSQARDKLAAASAGNKVFFGGGWTGSASNVVDIYTLQHYGTITSTQAFTLQDHTTVDGLMQLNGGSLGLGPYALTVGSMSGAAPIDLGSGTLTAGGDNTPSTTYSGALSGNGNLIKTGTGTLLLYSSSGHGGTTTVNAGTLQLGYGLALQNSTVHLSGGTLDVGSVNATLGGLSGSGSLDLKGTTLSVGNNGGTTVYSGVLSSATAGSLVKTGSGTLVLSNSSSYAGDTVISNGTLALGGGATASAILFFGGQVAAVNLTAPGAYYGASPSVTFSGDGTGAAATALMMLGDVFISNPGSGYATPPTVTISGGGGTGAVAHAVLGTGVDSGRVVAIVVDNCGGGYTSQPNISLSGGGGTTAATAVAGMQVGGIIVTNPGSGYSTPPTVHIGGGQISSTGSLVLSNGSTLTLAGGSLSTQSFNNSAAGTVNFWDGTLTVTGGNFNWGATNLTVNGNTASALPSLVLSGATPSGSYTEVRVGDTKKGSLTISGGTQLSSSTGNVGNSAGSTGTVTVEGSGSTWTNSNLYVGGSSTTAGGTGTLNVNAGGTVNVTGTPAGTLRIWSGGTVNLNGGTIQTGSLDRAGAFNWTSGTLRLINQFVAIASDSSAYPNNPFGDSLSIGAGKTLEISQGLSVGETSTGTLTITNGGQVSSRWGAVVGLVGSTATVTVDGDNSKWTNLDDLDVCNASATLTITGGGQVSNVGGSVASAATVTVDGANSKWTNSGWLAVGKYDSGTLTITHGGQVSNMEGCVGTFSGATGTVTVDGSGSTWTSIIVYLGAWPAPAAGAAGTLNVNTGGTVRVLDTLNVNTGGTVNLTGGTIETGYLSRDGAFNWTSGTLRLTDQTYIIGSTGPFDSLSIGAGKTLECGGLFVGFGDGGTLNVNTGGTVSVTGSYSSLIISSGGTVNLNGGTIETGYLSRAGVFNWTSGTLRLTDQNVIIDSAYEFGDSLSIGAGKTLEISLGLLVGELSGGTLTITGGGQVSSGIGYLGTSSGSTGTVTVDGSGSTWTNSNLYLGGTSTAAGGTGSLNVNNGGQVNVAGTLQLWKADSLVTVDGGTLSAGTLAGTTGSLRISDPPGGVALTVGSSANATFSGTLADSTTPGSLKKIGSGTQTLGGSNTYSGSTTINAGKLSISADNNLGTPPLSLILDQLKLDGGTLLATETFGLASTRGLTIAANSGIEVADTKTLTLLGSLTVGSGTTLTKTGLGTMIINGPQNWGANSVLQIGSSGGSGAEIVGASSADSVPEPATMLLLAIGGLCLLACVWRRRQTARPAKPRLSPSEEAKGEEARGQH